MVDVYIIYIHMYNYMYMYMSMSVVKRRLQARLALMYLPTAVCWLREPPDERLHVFDLYYQTEAAQLDSGTLRGVDGRPWLGSQVSTSWIPPPCKKSLVLQSFSQRVLKSERLPASDLDSMSAGRRARGSRAFSNLGCGPVPRISAGVTLKDCGYEGPVSA